MTKKYYLLNGISRAGNTLFGSLLNQNKDISVTGNSIIPDLLFKINKMRQEENFKNFPLQKQLDNVLNNVFNNYYENLTAKYIIDRSTWGLTDYMDLAKKHIPNELKIIVLVRDIPEVLASFVDHSNKNPDFFLNLVGTNPLEKCDFLMGYNPNHIGQIYGQLSAIKNLILNYRESIKIIEYNDLINNTKSTLDSVYDFLEIPKFNHSFENLSQLNIDGVSYDDTVLGGNLHTIKTDKIEKRKYDVEEVLTPYVYKKYSGYEIWRDL